MTVSAGDSMRAAVRFSMPFGQKAFNVLGLYCSAGTCTDAEMLTALDLWVVTAYAFLQSVMSNLVDIDRVRLSQVTFTAGEWLTSRVLGQIVPAFTSIVSDDMLPHSVAGVITFQTAAPKRRGRIFLPGLTEAAQSSSYLAAGVTAAMTNFANSIITTMLPGTANVDYAVLGSDGVSRLVTSITVNSLLGSQRRRKVGIGI